MTKLAGYITAIESLVPGTHPVDEDDLAAIQAKAVAKALDTHSKHKPLTVVEDVAGAGLFDYALDDLDAWADGYSIVRQVEYPVDDDYETAQILEDSEWTIYEKPEGKVLRFLEETPAAGKNIRVTYTARHTISTLVDCTVAAADEEAVQALAASFYCQILAAAYALDQDSTIAADSVNHASRRAEFTALSKQYRAEYNDHMGIKYGKPKPASMNQDQDVNYPWGMDRLTHPRRHR